MPIRFAPHYRKRLVAEMTTAPREELQRSIHQYIRASGSSWTCGRPAGIRAWTIVWGAMRPMTALVVVALLAIILGTFLWKLQSSGFAP